MKNSSWKYPFPTLEDKMFDQNNDGKLDAFETAFRDAHLDEMNRLVEEDQKKTKVKSYYLLDLVNEAKEHNIGDPEHPKASFVAVLLLVFLAIACIIGVFILPFIVECGAFVEAIIVFSALTLALVLLRVAGLY
ncbi:MAG: hypothetical protein ACI4I3_01250 [Acutalibacteraceae bacterium]